MSETMRHMEDQSALYFEQVTPLVKQLHDLAIAHGFPLIIVVQTSDEGYELTGNIPSWACNEMRDSFQWWYPEEGKNKL